MAFDAARIILRNIGTLLQYVAFLPLGLVPVALYYDERHALTGVLATFLAFIVSGFLLSRIPTRREPRLREGMLIAAVGWLLVPLGSVAVFMLVDGWRFLDAYFESMSAWTGTGVSVADLDVLSRTSHAWRSLMQWVGGLGVIILTLSILARPGTGAFTLYASEGREDKLRPSVLGTVRTIWRIYVVVTVVATVAFLLSGLTPWQAVNHALTGVATGGMSVEPASIGEYGSAAVEWTAIFVMLLGGTPFVVHYALAQGRWRRLVQDEQMRALLVMLVLTVPAVLWLAADALRPADPFREAVFQAVSAVTTTGWQTAAIVDWSPAAKVALGGVMVLGGAAGSTAGGIKLVRAALLVKGALWKLERAGLPHFAVSSFRFGDTRLAEDEANEEFAEAAFIGVLWMVLLFMGVIAMLVALPAEASVRVSDILFDVASVAGNVGLGVGVVGAALPDSAKIALMGVMWAARLEILPVLLLLRLMLPGAGNR